MNDNDIELDEITKAFHKLQNEVDYSTPFPTDMEYLEPDLPFDIDADHFIEWLQAEDLGEGDTYQEQVSSMCEYSCLYIAMKLILDGFKGDMKIHCGKFGFWEHYWLEYNHNGEKLFIDLTLQQFIPTAPRLAITKAHENRTGYTGHIEEYVDYSQSIEEYCKEKRAFMFYKLPQSIK